MGAIMVLAWLGAIIFAFVLLIIYMDKQGYRTKYHFYPTQIYCAYRESLAPNKETYNDVQNNLARFVGATDGPTKLKVFVGTWNVGDSAPPNEQLGEWIACDSDVIAVAAQECMYVPRNGATTVKDDWLKSIRNFLDETTNKGYVLVDSIDLREAIRLSVWVKADLAQHVYNKEKDKVSTKIPILWRKGGVAIKFQLFSTSLLFVNAHFTAHQHNVSARNEDARMILRMLRLGNKNFGIGNQFHYTFWINMERDEAFKLIDNQQWKVLENHDQLIGETTCRRVLDGFVEQPLRFQPTYKWKRNTGDYDRKAKRVPAWCDRVLVRTLPGCHLRPLEYKSVNTILSSDHMPVFATYEIEVENYCTGAQLLFARCNSQLLGGSAKNYGLSFEDFCVTSERVKRDATIHVLIVCAPFLQNPLNIPEQQFNSSGNTQWTVNTDPIRHCVLENSYVLAAVYESVVDESAKAQFLGNAVIRVGDCMEGKNTQSLPFFKGGTRAGTFQVNVGVHEELSHTSTYPCPM